MWIADIGVEKFDIAPGGFVAKIGDQSGHNVQRVRVGADLGLLDSRWKLSLGRLQNAPSTPITHV
jgi:hypothetical protein